jgi:hypothetical protein
MKDIESSIFLMRWLRKTCFLSLLHLAFYPDESHTKTFRWGFDGVDGFPVPSSLDYIDYTSTPPTSDEDKVKILEKEVVSSAAACADAMKALLRQNK